MRYEEYKYNKIKYEFLKCIQRIYKPFQFKQVSPFSCSLLSQCKFCTYIYIREYFCCYNWISTILFWFTLALWNWKCYNICCVCCACNSSEPFAIYMVYKWICTQVLYSFLCAFFLSFRFVRIPLEKCTVCLRETRSYIFACMNVISTGRNWIRSTPSSVLYVKGRWLSTE